jgi:hypothetical protein
MNRSASPAASRWDVEAEAEEEMRAVMNTLRGDQFKSLCVAGLLTCGSPSSGGLPGFPVAMIAEALSAHSCGGSHGFGPDWVVLTVFPVRPAVRLAGGHHTRGSVVTGRQDFVNSGRHRLTVQKRHRRSPAVNRGSTKSARSGKTFLTLSHHDRAS